MDGALPVQGKEVYFPFCFCLLTRCMHALMLLVPFVYGIGPHIHAVLTRAGFNSLLCTGTSCATWPGFKCGVYFPNDLQLHS